MCFKKPKPPVQSAADKALEADLTAQRKEARAEQLRQRAQLKEERFQQELMGVGGGWGRSSLFSGGRGGGGFAAPMVRSLLSVGP